MPHTYGRSRAGGRQLCLRRLQTAGQDYSWHWGQPAAVAARPCPEGCASSRAGWHTLTAATAARALCPVQSSVYPVLQGTSCPDPVALILQGCSVLLLSPSCPPHLPPWEGDAAGVRISFGITSRDIWLSLAGIWMSSLDAGAGSSALGISAHSPQGCPKHLLWWLMVTNGNIWETGSVLMENGQALKEKEGVLYRWAFPESAGHCFGAAWTVIWHSKP